MQEQEGEHLNVRGRVLLSQTFGIRNRSIQTHTRIAQSILDCSVGVSSNNKVDVVQIDSCKKFDHVRHDVVA